MHKTGRDMVGIKNILAADIGGTNSRFGHFTVSGDGMLELKQTLWLSTADADSLGGLFDSIMLEEGFELTPEMADIISIAVAGPVERGVYANPPLMPFDIDITDGCAGGITRCTLINDFVAQAYACLTPAAQDAELVIDGEPEAGATIAVLGAGTGLGKAALVPDGMGGYAAMASEGGHLAFAFMGEGEHEYERFLLERTGKDYITPNDVVSGGGLSLLHEFLTDGTVIEPKEMASVLGGAEETLEWASRFYGRVARDFALDTLALGGLYIAGGVAARTPALVRSDAFSEEFHRSHSMAEILGHIPVYLQSDQDSGLWGAAMKGFLELEGGGL